MSEEEKTEAAAIEVEDAVLKAEKAVEAAIEVEKAVSNAEIAVAKALRKAIIAAEKAEDA